MDEEQFNDLERKLNDIRDMQDQAGMTTWEESFIADQFDRLEKYGSGIRMSEKQMNIVDRIHGRLPL